MSSSRRRNLGIPELIVLMAVVLGLGLVSVLSISSEVLVQLFWLVAGLVGAIALVIILVMLVHARRQARKWRLFKLADIDHLGGIEFEHYLAKLLQALKYQNVRVTGIQGDFGVDLLYQKEGITYAAQVKRKRGLVGVEALYQAVGGRDFYNADQAVVITNSNFSYAAQKFAKQSKVTLIDREKLATMIVEAQQD